MFYRYAWDSELGFILLRYLDRVAETVCVWGGIWEGRTHSSLVCFTLVKTSLKANYGGTWWCYVIIALTKLWQENGDFRASVGYTVRPCI